MKINYYMPSGLIIGTMAALTIDLSTDMGFIDVKGDVWKVQVYTWLIYIGGILTHKFYSKASKNIENEEIYR